MGYVSQSLYSVLKDYTLTEHRLLTGASLHEPKGVESATAGQVYVANGTGSGVWTDKDVANLTLNRFSLSGTVPDVSEATSFYSAVPAKSTLTKLYAVLSGSITVADSVVTIYKNSIAQTPTITIPFTGSGPGVTKVVDISPAIAFNEGDVVRVASDGASTGSQALAVSLSFTAVS